MNNGAWEKWTSTKKNTYALYLASLVPRVPIVTKIITCLVV